MVFGALVVSKIIYIFKIRLDNEIRYQNKKKMDEKNIVWKINPKSRGQYVCSSNLL